MFEDVLVALLVGFLFIGLCALAVGALEWARRWLRPYRVTVNPEEATLVFRLNDGTVTLARIAVLAGTLPAHENYLLLEESDGTVLGATDVPSTAISSGASRPEAAVDKDAAGRPLPQPMGTLPSDPSGVTSQQ